MSASFLWQKIHSPWIVISFTILEQSKVIPIQAGRGCYIVICFHPAFTKMIDGTEKPKILSKFVIRAARYNEFRCKVRSVYKTTTLKAKTLKTAGPGNHLENDTVCWTSGLYSLDLR